MENTIVIGYAGGYASYRINHERHRATPTTLTDKEVRHVWTVEHLINDPEQVGSMIVDQSFKTLEFDTPRAALDVVANLLGWFEVTDDVLLPFAKKMGFQTLKVRRSDRLDFRDVGVTRARDALAAAYKAGQESNELATVRAALAIANEQIKCLIEDKKVLTDEANKR